ncbi:MAG TPA: hypothetical protein PKE00_09405 [Planctomycetota bacterium]|nr:hypothetical protein [Planctomycetota bacterium]
MLRLVVDLLLASAPSRVERRLLITSLALVVRVVLVDPALSRLSTLLTGKERLDVVLLRSELIPPTR